LRIETTYKSALEEKKKNKKGKKINQTKNEKNIGTEGQPGMILFASHFSAICVEFQAQTFSGKFSPHQSEKSLNPQVAMRELSLVCQHAGAAFLFPFFLVPFILFTMGIVVLWQTLYRDYIISLRLPECISPNVIATPFFDTRHSQLPAALDGIYVRQIPLLIMVY
tara:strand:- start:44 stop:541 length:498 start_codon:yes stop_codon:yes gene_type:complete